MKTSNISSGWDVDSPTLREIILAITGEDPRAPVMTNNIMAAIDAALPVPEKKDNEHNLGTYYASDIDQIEKAAIGAIYEVAGWNDCVEQMQAIKREALE